MNPGAANLYIYYRVRAADAPQLITAVRDLQANWRSELPGLDCTLSQRVDDSESHLTLMETYAHPQGLSPEWQRTIEAGVERRLGGWIDGERHVERFEPCA